MATFLSSSIVTRKGYRGQLRFYYSYDMASALAETIEPSMAHCSGATIKVNFFFAAGRVASGFFILQILAFMKNASKFNFDWNEFDPSRPFVGKKSKGRGFD